jgi:hypothetical protein
MPERRFPPPWSVEKQEVCFIVKDSGGQKLAYIYFEEEPGRRLAAKLLTLTRRGALLPTWRSCRSCVDPASNKSLLSASPIRTPSAVLLFVV